MAAQMTGAEILLECLAREGVEHIFGYPGGATLPVYEALYDHGIRHVLMRHEENACFAAEGYACASGRVGVCCATSGPGATNLMTGLANAHMDSIPVVAITGQVSTKVLGTTAFQEADTFGISLPCTKHNYQVRKIEDLPRVIHEAFLLASTGRRGPVLVDIPKDVQLGKARYVPCEEVHLPGYKVLVDGDPAQIAQAIQLIWASERPLVYAGGGIVSADAAAELREFVGILDAPTVCTLMGLGGLPAEDPNFVSMPGMHGTYAANMGLTHADLLIALGVRFDDRVTGKLSGFAPHAKVIHVDIDPAEIGKNRKVEAPIVGDLRSVLQQLNHLLRETSPLSARRRGKERHAWSTQVRGWKAEYPLVSKPSEDVIKPQHLMTEIDRLTAGSTIVCCDVGQHQMWAAQFIRFYAPRLWINSGGLGSMGFGLPAAIGAQIARPDKLILALVGDGGFQMSIPELATIANYGLPIKVVVVNNGHLGMVRQWQELFHGNRLSAVRLDTFPEVSQLAGAYGLRGRTVAKPEELAPALQEAANQSGPCLLNVQVAPFENVYPMVPTGAALHEMVLEPSLDAPGSTMRARHVPAAAQKAPEEALSNTRRMFALQVQDAPGALQRILGVITVQGCGIRSLSVRQGTKPGVLKVTLALEGDEIAILRAVQQISKLVNVLEVLDFSRRKGGARPKTQLASPSGLAERDEPRLRRARRGSEESGRKPQ
ncbi:MAG: biosynthetic-type acetolactate synthase large subunit [Terriglobia bacterium]|jgi:acetolactate synthase-1/2/3 large subunit